jgi:hypothetical protein
MSSNKSDQSIQLFAVLFGFLKPSNIDLSNGKKAHQRSPVMRIFMSLKIVCCSLWVIVNGTKAAELTTRKVTVTVTDIIGEMNGVENR